MYLIFPVLFIVIVTVIILLQCLSCSFGHGNYYEIPMALDRTRRQTRKHYDCDYDNDKK